MGLKLNETHQVLLMLMMWISGKSFTLR
jgi:hypothetical protein